MPADAEIALLLQTVWDLLAGGEHWPTYRTVDLLLYREHGLDVDTVIARAPEALLLGGRPHGGARPSEQGQLQLTAPGAALCQGTGAALDVFLPGRHRTGPAAFSRRPADAGRAQDFADAR